ncbi:MAG TPA: hypothetical protein VFW78_06395 [Bacteroidia bacterium]|nr:hypothetical protein [Bacteroidia bacterium]
MEGAKIDVLHSEHREWLNKLEFYKDDIMVLRNRLEEIVMKNTSSDVLAMVEHFQNQFIIQRNEIDEFHHAIKEHENEVERAVNHNPVAVNRQRLADHPQMRERMERFEEIFHDLRQELIRFLAKVM